MPPRLSFAAVVVAAGSGVRAGGAPKQLREVAGEPLVRWSVRALAAAGADPVIVVRRPEDEAALLAALQDLPVVFADGGARRCDSVRAGLAAAPDGAEAVLVHDAARPFVGAQVVGRLLEALETAEGAIPALPVADTLKRGDAAGMVVATEPRDALWRAQTPQAFRIDALRRAYAALPPSEEPTDDAAVLERVGFRVVLVPGDPLLAKITYPEDFDMAERLAGAARIVRVGSGFDAHRFTDGDHVTLCGVRIPHDQGLLGHSDADAGLHAVTDALLGAVALGDIGDHFPPTDPRWKDADSAVFLRHALSLVQARGGRVLNVDVTLICERPKVKAHREAMRARVAEILELPLDRVSVKATTTEEMGFTGRREGVAAQATASVETPA